MAEELLYYAGTMWKHGWKKAQIHITNIMKQPTDLTFIC